MKIYIWEEIENATDNWHPEGGLVVVAGDIVRAKELAAGHGAKIKSTELPNLILDVEETQERVFIMPNAGCC